MHAMERGACDARRRVRSMERESVARHRASIARATAREGVVGRVGGLLVSDGADGLDERGPVCGTASSLGLSAVGCEMMLLGDT